MTKEERKRVGRKLKALRTERGLRQEDVASDPKSDHLSLGTLQAIEGNWYEVRDMNIEKYARFFGTTVKKLLLADEPRAVTPSDPLLRDLHEEHLEVARGYMRARKRVRACVELLLSNRASEESLTALLMKLDTLSPERLGHLEALVFAEPEGDQIELLHRIWQRLVTDPGYAAIAKQGLDLLDQLPTPTPKTQAQKPDTQSTRTRRP